MPPLNKPPPHKPFLQISLWGLIQRLPVKESYEYLFVFYLKQVTIKDHSGSRYVFSCEDWLVKQAGENKLKAHLSLSEQNLDQLPSYRGKKLEYMKLDDKEHLDAVEETVHKNLSNVLEGILQSSLEPDADSVSEFPNSGSLSSCYIVKRHFMFLKKYFNYKFYTYWFSGSFSWPVFS